MPRVTYVQSARKDNPAVKAGEPYYWWKFRHGGKRYSKIRPRPSQLTQSAYLSGIRSLVERVEDFDSADYEGFADFRDEIVADLQELRDQCQDSLDNMPESLQYSPTGEMLQERIDACDSAESDIEGLDVDLYDENDYEDEDEAAEALDDILQNCENAVSDMEDALSQCDL